jgi:hypothetical protein
MDEFGKVVMAKIDDSLSYSKDTTMGFQNMHPWWDAKIERERVFVGKHTKLSGLISWASGGLLT